MHYDFEQIWLAKINL